MISRSISNLPYFTVTYRPSGKTGCLMMAGGCSRPTSPCHHGGQTISSPFGLGAGRGPP